jgi:hypothetical protein
LYRYVQVARPKLKISQPELKKLVDIAKVLGEQWKQMDPADRALYEKMAEVDKASYQSEIAAYVPTDTSESPENEDLRTKLLRLKRLVRFRDAAQARGAKMGRVAWRADSWRLESEETAHEATDDAAEPAQTTLLRDVAAVQHQRRVVAVLAAWATNPRTSDTVRDALLAFARSASVEAMVHPVYERTFRPSEEVMDWEDFTGEAVPMSAIVRCAGGVDVRTDWWFGQLSWGDDDQVRVEQPITSFSAWWRDAGDALGQWRVITAYRCETSEVHEGGGRYYGATGTDESGTENILSWAEKVGLSALSAKESACVMTVIAGPRPGPDSNACLAWEDAERYRFGIGFGDHGGFLGDVECSLRELRLVCPNPTPYVRRLPPYGKPEKPVEGEFDDVLKYLRLWDGSA